MFGLSGDEELIVNIVIVFVTVLVAGMMSGLTLALFSLEENYLKVVVTSGTHSEMRSAQRLLPLLQEPHWLLVTLLLCNAAAVESLPLALDQLVSPAVAIILSVTMVLLFGEIIPQAVFVRHALFIGGLSAVPLRGLMFLTGIISYPLGKLLDKLVGHKISVLYRRFEMREFIRLQVAEAQAAHSSSSSEDSTPRTVAIKDGDGDDQQLDSHKSSLVKKQDDDSSSSSDEDTLTRPELSIMLGALSLSEGTSATILKTTINKVFSVSMDAVVDKALVDKIFDKGFSRVLVYEGDPRNITHYLIAKTLILLIFRNEEDAPKVRDLVLRKPLFFGVTTPLHELYTMFQKGESHVAVIRDESPEQRVLGITTVEDLMELLHQTNFLDETDMESQRPVQVLMSQWKKDQKAAKHLRQQQKKQLYYGHQPGSGSMASPVPGGTGFASPVPGPAPLPTWNASSTRATTGLEGSPRRLGFGGSSVKRYPGAEDSVRRSTGDRRHRPTTRQTADSPSRSRPLLHEVSSPARTKAKKGTNYGSL